MNMDQSPCLMFDTKPPDSTNISRLHSTQSFGSASTLTRAQPAKPGGPEQKRSMSKSDAGGYVEPSRGSDLIDLFVQCLNGDGCMLKLSGSCTGLEVYRMVSKQLPQKKGAQITLHHLDLSLILHKELHAQGIIGKAATLSCTFVPTDLYAAWCTVQGLPVSQGELALAGVTRIEGSNLTKYLHHLPESLEHLTFGSEFNHSLEGVTLPSSLQTLTFGTLFRQRLEGVTLPSSLQSLTFVLTHLNQSVDRSDLAQQSAKLDLWLWHLTKAWTERLCQAVCKAWPLVGHFNQRIGPGVTLPSSLCKALPLASHFNQILFGVTLPSSLQSLTFVHCDLNQKRGQLRPCPAICKAWPLAMAFNQRLGPNDFAKQSAKLDLWRLTSTRELDQVTLPSSLCKALPLAFTSTRILFGVTLPSSLQSLTFVLCT